ncbi:hypothetical protein Asppvi_008415 [Aspergillus pseudoviridinutans]|uniref:Zn(2)-C6 fungal-type domain-containing protein n=1 Tax=Aspergillus pseudoviridinutans TaxID=1517512 RepID=A0A9P3BI75_9EURO|nr:uncharacterized protein Asppvi_008415 [Aspergillus pseudoviridinutans]GIJ89473.1 hypothetical protein Asppvi_008415 [Aspergillus pseudoviridinutans]
MSSASLAHPHVSLRHRRYKAALACATCRRRKVKCDGLRPVCGRCQRKTELQETCSYVAASARRRSSTVNDPLSSAAASPQLPTPGTSAQTRSEPSDVIGTPSAHAAGDPGEFSFEVKAAVEAKLGLPSSKKRCPIPLTDAPLFGLLSLPVVIDVAVNPADNVLPPRKHADHLANLYWRCLDPLEPLLDHRSFCTAYQALFDGGEMACDEQSFLCTLNLIFALSTQLQESTPSEQRDSTSRTFFLRAWHLLRPEMVLWQPGSLEIIQCLVLMTRYLQCTPNLQQTWMALGSAVRIALNIGLDRSEKNPTVSDGETQLTRDVWLQCLFMDRNLSWSLGRPSTVPSVPFFTLGSLRNGSNLPGSDDMADAAVPEKMQEVARITGYIGISQGLPASSAAEGQDLVLQTQAEPSVVMQIDERLIRLENSLPPLPHNAASGETSNVFDGRLTLLRLRLAHTRIMLLRPLMSRFCLSHLQTHQVSPAAETSIGDRVLQTCATVCVENAQKLITLIRECSRPDMTGLIPWWYRIFYLRIAMLHLVAAMLRSDVFGTVASESWNTAVSVFGSHEHLSLSVRRCLNKLQMMWQRVIDIHYPPGNEAPPSRVDYHTGLQDVFEYLGFDAHIPLFGLEDPAWLDNVDWTTWSA